MQEKLNLGWTLEGLELLFKIRQEIERCGGSKKLIADILYEWDGKNQRIINRKVVRQRPREWMGCELYLLFDLRENKKMKFWEIGRRMGRTEESVRMMYVRSMKKNEQNYIKQ